MSDTVLDWLTKGGPNGRALSALRLCVEIILILALAWLIAGLIWQITGSNLTLLPDTRQGANGYIAGPPPVRANLDTLTAFDAFNRDVPAAAALTDAPAPETRLNLTLLGIRFVSNMDGEETGGSAIIKLQSGLQRAYRIGDEIIDGVTLAGVRQNHVRLSRAGIEESLFLDGTDLAAQRARLDSFRQTATGGDAPPNPTIPNENAANSSSRVTRSELQDLFQTVSMTPRRSGRRITGWTLVERGEGGQLARFGLEQNDILTAINDFELTTAERLREVAEELAGSDDLVLHFERDGAPLTRRFQYAP